MLLEGGKINLIKQDTIRGVSQLAAVNFHIGTAERIGEADRENAPIVAPHELKIHDEPCKCYEIGIQLIQGTKNLFNNTIIFGIFLSPLFSVNWLW